MGSAGSSTVTDVTHKDLLRGRILMETIYSFLDTVSLFWMAVFFAVFYWISTLYEKVRREKKTVLFLIWLLEMTGKGEFTWEQFLLARKEAHSDYEKGYYSYRFDCFLNRHGREWRKRVQGQGEV
jgi:hypothetical protein